MIDPKELRIGAHVEYKGERLIVGAISGTDVSLIKSSTPIAIYKDVWCAYIEPIPITPELLTEIGFEKVSFADNAYTQEFGDEYFMQTMRCIILDGKWCVEYYDDDNVKEYIHCQYLHELEQFAYKTTKTELIKE